MNIKKLNFFLLICLPLLLASLFLTGCTREGEVEDLTETLVQIGDSEVKTRERDVDTIPDFTRQKQEIGKSSETPYVLMNLRDTEMPGFHRIVFEIEGEEEPNILASYDGQKDAISLVFKSLVRDDVQLGESENLEINRDCVLGVTRLESEEENENIYEVMLSGFQGFRLYAQEIDEDIWSVFLDIQYLDLEEVVTNTGLKTVGEAVASDGARIVSYYYERDQNVFRFVWGTKSSKTKPIPKVQGRYNADGDIIVVFPDLESDYIAINAHQIEMSGVVEGISWNRTDGESMYKFDLKEKRDFELKSDPDSAEVILEITLW
jgi:hypothetical protein